MKLTIALAQIRSSLFDKETNLQRILESMTIAHNKKAQYILFPELFLTGFAIEDRIEEMAESLDGEIITKIRRNARALNMGVIVGFPEKDGNHIYNSSVFIDNNGNILGVYRKIHLFDHEKKYFKAGDQVPIFHTPVGKMGVMITYDMEFPEISRILSVKGAHIILVLCSNMIPYQQYQDTYLRARAMENHIFIAAANRVGLENDYVYFGESKLTDPTGKTLSKALNNEEISVTAIDLSETHQAKGVLDYISNRRPDIYSKEGLV
ncbi:carbon-nitrogen hydrolase family protein [Pseudalkalibacillus decolorationis]|uniref:carbon-nitrogen hydrolase family protein n=1 Tax=Pseudalkalibacillus decolorationis TaxID=163879 RepID=UPI002148EC18|nr:carbon-nitrogen hydrolase family protein [Pseudalkalibacillus decolorationis]